MAPARTFNIRSGAQLGIDVVQVGATISITGSKRRTSSVFYMGAALPGGTDPSITVAITGGDSDYLPSSAPSAGLSRRFPTDMTVNTWYEMGVTTLDLPINVSSIELTITWDYPDDSWAAGSKSYTIPITPVYDPPAAPTSVTATNVDDVLAMLAWTPNPTTEAPYVSQTVQRRENGGAWTNTATVAPTATTYNAIIFANRKYEFRIVASNSRGATNSDPTDPLLTTPTKLASLTAVQVTSGGNIKVTLSKLDVPYDECEIILERSDGGGAYSTVHTFAATDLSRSTTTDWTDTTSPSSGTVQYRATIQTDGGTQGTLTSATTLSNLVTLNVPPGAPTNLTSGLVDIAIPVTLTWEHTPSVDGATQTSRQIQYSTDGGTTPVNIVTGNSTANTYDWTVSSGDFTPGQTILWRVRTAGSQPGTYGTYSAWQSITLRQSLSVSVTAPTGTWEGGDIPVTWTATPAWGTASQVAYHITMTTGGVTVYDSGTVASSSPTGTIPASFQQNLTEYTIQVTVTDNYGLVSLPDATTIETDFLTPGPVDITWQYDDNLGQLIITPEFSSETSSELDDTTSWMLERSPDGTTYELVGVFEGDTPIGDTLARTGADSYYRTTGYTELGVAGPQTIHLVPAADVKSKWARLTYGETTIRFGWSQAVEIEAGRASESYDIEGSNYPAAVFGGPLYEKYTITGRLLYGNMSPNLASSTPDELREFAKTAGVCLFRDARGTYFTARAHDIKVSPARTNSNGNSSAGFSMTVERVTA